MELEEMKNLWQEMSAGVEKQKKLTDSLIIKMTQMNYKNKLNKILIPEAVSAPIAFGAAVFISVNIMKLNTPLLLGCGIISILISFLMPILSINSILRMRSLNVSANNYKESLLEYSKAKMHFVFIQKLSFIFGAMILVTGIPVMCQLMGKQYALKTNQIWYSYVIAFPFFLLFARWVFKYYIKSASSAGNILKELAD